MPQQKPKQKSLPDLNTRRIQRINKGLEWVDNLQTWSANKLLISVVITLPAALLLPKDHIITHIMRVILGITLALSFVSILLFTVVGMFWLFEKGIQWTESVGTEKRKRTPPKGIPTPETRSLTDDQTEA